MCISVISLDTLQEEILVKKILLQKKKKNCEILLYELIHQKVDCREWPCGHFDAKIDFIVPLVVKKTYF